LVDFFVANHFALVYKCFISDLQFQDGDAVKEDARNRAGEDPCQEDDEEAFVAYAGSTRIRASILFHAVFGLAPCRIELKPFLLVGAATLGRMVTTNISAISSC